MKGRSNNIAVIHNGIIPDLVKPCAKSTNLINMSNNGTSNAKKWYRSSLVDFTILVSYNKSMFQIILRNSTSFVFAITAIIIYNTYPHDTFNNNLIRVLLSGFVYFGITHWLSSAIYNVVESPDVTDFWKWVFFVLRIIVVLYAVICLSTAVISL